MFAIDLEFSYGRVQFPPKHAGKQVEMQERKPECEEPEIIKMDVEDDLEKSRTRSCVALTFLSLSPRHANHWRTSLPN